jgi:hypothetical protein
MSDKKVSVREARMELEFAMVQGDKNKIAAAEKQLQEALIEAAERRRKTKSENRPLNKRNH